MTTTFRISFIISVLFGVGPLLNAQTIQYEGKIGPYPVHMSLFFRSDNTVTGSYYYDSQRVKGNSASISLRGIYTGDYENGEIFLREYSPSGKEIGMFSCKLNGGHETNLEAGVQIRMVWIEGEAGYRNYISGKQYNVYLEQYWANEIHFNR